MKKYITVAVISFIIGGITGSLTVSDVPEKELFDFSIYHTESLDTVRVDEYTYQITTRSINDNTKTIVMPSKYGKRPRVGH